jgi:hypothetical protein
LLPDGRKKMKLGFLVLRDTFLKTMGSLIEASLKSGYTAIIFYDETLSSTSKAYQRVTSEKLLGLISLGAVTVKLNLTDFVKIVEQTKVDVLVTHEGSHTLKAQRQQIIGLRKKGIKVVSLCHFFEISAQPLEALGIFDKTYYLSKYARDLHFSLQSPASQTGEALQKYNNLFEITGSPMFDQLVGLDQFNSKRDLGIPRDKQVVLLFAPVLTQATIWRFYVLREANMRKRIARVIQDKKWTFFWEALKGPSFIEIVKAIKSFCVKNNAFLLVKSRPKQKDPKYLSALADRYIDGIEDAYFPVFSSYKLISAADLCIGVMSMGVVESLAQSKPTINIYLPPSADYPISYTDISANGRTYLEAVSRRDLDGPFANSGNLINLERTDVVRWFQNRSFADLDFDKQASSDYKRRILGISDIPSSEKILNSLTELAR